MTEYRVKQIKQPQDFSQLLEAIKKHSIYCFQSLLWGYQIAREHNNIPASKEEK